MIRRMNHHLGTGLGLVMMLGLVPMAPAMPMRPAPIRPVNPIVRPNVPPNHMPGWDWWRTYPWSPYNAYRNPYWYPSYAVPPVVYPPVVNVNPPVTTPIQEGAVNNVPTPTGPLQTPPPGSALIKVQLPDMFGKVMFNGQDPVSVGTTRYYTTPHIKAGSTQNYTVSATFKQNGQTVTQSQQITVGQGQTVNVSF